MPAAYLAHLSATQKRAITSGQTLWLRTQTESDPRLATLSEPVTADDLNHALWVLRSLFGAQAAALESVSLYGAMGWASVLLRLADEATNARRAPLLPLPYYALTAQELDARELPSELEWASRTGRAAPQTTQKSKTQPKQSTTRGGRAHAESHAKRATREQAPATATPTAAAAPAAGATRGGGGRRPRATAR